MSIVRDINDEEQNAYTSHDLMKLTFEKIDRCDLIIIEFTEKGVGLGIEAGYAYAKNIPILTIVRTGSEISETLLGISTKVFFYKSIEESENLIHQYL